MAARSGQLADDPSNWEIDLARRELRARGTPVALGNRAFDIVEVLVQSAGELVSKDDLIRRVWPGAIIEENTLQVHISAIRKALGADRGLLTTASGRGYRLLGDWKIRRESEPAERHAWTPAGSRPIEKFQGYLPLAASDLIGRGAAVQHLRDLLSAYRAVTLTGPGGIGKTVLALEIARALLPSFEGECRLVELASLSDAGLVPSAVVGVLGLKLGSEISAEAVARALGQTRRLLILDNCEHVIDATATFVETVVRQCPNITVLATSREVLRIAGEFVYRVPPLQVPPEHRQDADDLLDHSAVQLFVARVRSLDSDFATHAENLPAIAAICRRLDGIPLAIEFAAARAAALGVGEVAAGLDNRFALLTSGRRTALPRHQTLRAALDWSYELLPPSEQHVLRRLAVFAGGFTLDAAGAVMDDTDHAEPAAVEGIASLVSKSLVTLDGSGPVRRWRLLETIRAYASEKLREHREADEAALRHAEYFRDLIVPSGTSMVMRLSVDDVARYAHEIDNVRAALTWSFSAAGDAATGVALTAAFAPVWLHLSLIIECRERAEQALAVIASSGSELVAPLERRLHVALAVSLILAMGPVERARAVVAKARALAESVDDGEAQLRMLWAQWSLEFTTGECRAAQATARHFSEVARRIDDDAEAAMLVGDRLLAHALQYSGDQRAARKLLERVLERYVAPKSRRHTILFHYDQHALARAMLARVLWLQGSIDRANEEARASLEEAQAADPGFSVCWVLHYGVCPVALMTGDIAAADRAVTMMVDLASRLDAPIWHIVARCWEGKLAIEHGEFSGGAQLLADALETSERTGWLNCYPQFMGMRAEGLAGLGQPGEALAAVEQALAKAETGGERWYEPELLRVNGEALLQQAGERSIPAAENCFERGLAVAREQGALSWELRLATSVARLRKKQDRADEARQVLAPVYEMFSEGLGTSDLRSARALLESLQA